MDPKEENKSNASTSSSKKSSQANSSSSKKSSTNANASTSSQKNQNTPSASSTKKSSENNWNTITFSDSGKSNAIQNGSLTREGLLYVDPNNSNSLVVSGVNYYFYIDIN